MSDPLLVILLILLGIGLVIGVLVALGARIMRIPEEERRIIYRGGRYNRIAGPGYIFVMTLFETVERSYDVRELPHPITTHQLYLHSQPFQYTFELWYRTDLEAATGGEPNQRELLRMLAMNSEPERRLQLRNILTQTVQAAIPQIKSPIHSAVSGDVEEQLLLLAPGLPGASEIIHTIEPILRARLREIGLVMSKPPAILISQIHLDDRITDNLTSARVGSLLRKQYPDLPPDTLAKVLSTIHGLEQPRVDHMTFESNQAVRPEVRMRHNEAGEMEQQIKLRIDDGRAEAMQSAGSPAETVPVPSDEEQAESYLLTEQDIAVLKTIPRLTDRAGTG